VNVSSYQLLDQGINPREFLSKLSPRTAHKIASSWEWRARPGQRWTPGAEFITDYECGRGWGKDFAAAENLCDAAEDPERWGGYAVIGGPDPRQVKRDCLTGPSGLFVAAERRAKSGNGPGIVSINLNDRVLKFEAPRGGGTGLTVYWGASSDPKSFRGPNYGLAWLDEFGIWYHNAKDEQGTNAWQALLPALRAGPDPKVLITQTPSRAPEVRELQRDAERPECPTCQTRMLSMMPEGRWRGEPGQEPWRLPPSPRNLVHALLQTRRTVVERRCPTCQTLVIARVCLVTGSTLDNPFLAKAMRGMAKRALASGTPAARAEFAPEGEADAAPRGALVKDEQVERIEIQIGDHHPDRYRGVLEQLGALEVVVFVDPAVTSNEHSDDTGIAVSCIRRRQDKDGIEYRQVVALEDLTVRPVDVDGAPSGTWAPIAYRAALKWGASRIIVETNQGGEEVLAAVRATIAAPPPGDKIAKMLSEEMNRPIQASNLPSLIPMALRMQGVAMNLRVESVHRATGKPARFGWYGEGAARGEQALACIPWLDGARHWLPAMAQATGYDPGVAKGKDKKDRFDAIVAASQVLLGVRETRGTVIQGAPWQDPGALYRGL
jgi:phage terminase large subunit-like protein